jgi:hypothetical protein
MLKKGTNSISAPFMTIIIEYHHPIEAMFVSSQNHGDLGGGDWKGLRRILTYRGFVPPQSPLFDKKRTGPEW